LVQGEDADISTQPDTGNNLAQTTPAQGETQRPIHCSKRPAHFNDYLCYSTQPNDSTDNSSIATPSQSKSSGMCYTIANYVSYEKFTATHQHFVAAITKIMEPKHFQEAIKDPLWLKAMAEEIRAFEANKTWTIEDLPPSKKPISC